MEDGVAVVIFEDGGRAYVPAEHLPAGAGEGTVLHLEWRVDTAGGTDDVAALIARLRSRTEEHY